MEERKCPLWVTWALILLSALSCAYGFMRGESDTVLVKAVNICMECIGIG